MLESTADCWVEEVVGCCALIVMRTLRKPAADMRLPRNHGDRIRLRLDLEVFRLLGKYDLEDIVVADLRLDRCHGAHLEL